MVALTCNLDLFGPRLLTGLPAILLAGRHNTLTRYVRASGLFSGSHVLFSFFHFGRMVGLEICELNLVPDT